MKPLEPLRLARAGSDGVEAKAGLGEIRRSNYGMTCAERIIESLLDDEQLPPAAMTRAHRVDHVAKTRIYRDAWEAEASVPRSGWRDWRVAGVQFSAFHREGTPFALPFRPDSYLWAGPFTLRLPVEDVESARQGYRWAHYQRGVRKYANMLARGIKPPPVVLLYHDAWGWTMQDGNHRYEALAKAGATTYDAFLGRPKRKQAFDSF